MRLLLAFLVVVVGLICGLVFYATEDYYKKPLGKGTTTLIFEVSPGESFSSLSRRLEEQKLIEHPELLNLLARFYGVRGKIRAGEYELKDSLSPKEIMLVISSGKSINYPFTITEGLNSYEIALNFERRGLGKRDEFMRLCSDPLFLESILGTKVQHCEGYLFPETYNFEKRTTPRQLIETMLRAFIRNYNLVAKGRNLGGWSRHQILTFASLIEKETGAAEERPIIASVFYNRLQKGIRLQTDPTVQYGILAETGVYSQNITKKDLLTPTPYNTYTREGLPPGPISNPGRDSLRAVFEPSQTEYYFFVSRNDGTHVFSRTYEEHQLAVRNFQLNPRAREGKSWRDLKN
jgi:UPF0755 protein